jgi:hypothetical protein
MRVYADGYFSSNDEVLVEQVKILTELKGDIIEERYQQLHFKLSENLRRSMGTNKVLGFGMHREEDEVGIISFPVKSDGTFYDPEYDSEKQLHYIEAEEGVLL